MIYHDITKTIPATEESPETTKTVRLGYADGCLNVYYTAVVDGAETYVLAITQPWKCLADGSRADFVDATDAFAWAESVKDTLL
jgi:hypothetical protein